MKILVLGGFLGSGKTSQLIRLAEYVSACMPLMRESKKVTW